MSIPLSEQEIRPKELMDEQARRFAHDVARLMRHRADFVRVPCPACGGAEEQPAFEKMGMPFVQCLGCRTIFANPRPLPEHLDEYYRESENYAYWNRFIFPASAEVRREKIFKPRVEKVLELCRRYGLPTGVLLEIGAGFGLFCEELLKTGVFQTVIAVEPTPDLAETCRSRGLQTIEKPIERIERAEIILPGQAIDVIVHFEVIEHLFSPRAFLQQCADLLEPGGILMLTCPNGLGFDIAVMGPASSAVDVEHLNLFNPDSLALLLEQCGFETMEMQTPGRLDAELVRNRVLSGDFSLEDQPFLKRLLVEEWALHGQAFQDFLVQQQLSSNMLLVARRKK